MGAKTMKRVMDLSMRGLAALILASAAAPAFAQQPPKPEPEAPEQEEEKIDELDPFGRGQRQPSPGQEEMEELFLKVDKRLQRITELLFEASSGDGSGAGEIGSAGIDELIRQAEAAASGAQSDIEKLLEASQRQSEAAAVEIDRILEIAAQNPQGGGGGGGQSPPPPSSGEGQPQQGQTPSGSQREEKGQRPGEQPGEQQGQEQQGEQPGEQNQPQSENGERPTGNKESEAGQDGKGQDPGQSELGSEASPRGNEDWGDLPIHLRKVFQNGVSDDVPPRYRDWVDSYYERLRKGSR